MNDEREPRQVRHMFGSIARRYDLLNHLLSANLDRSWRRAAARELPRGGTGRVLDLCGGTGDLTLAMAGEFTAGTFVCCDFSHPMLRRAADKFAGAEQAGRCSLLEADALRLPFGPGTFDAVVVGFGVRNLADLQAGLREMLRVLRPGGKLVLLEFSRPSTPIVGHLYSFYLSRVLPRIGDSLGGGRGAYAYLARTVAAFPGPVRLAEIVEATGFSTCRWRALTCGIVALHSASKPAAPEIGSGAA